MIPFQHKQDYKKNYKHKLGNYSKVKSYYIEALGIPLYNAMSDKGVKCVIDNMLSLGE